LIQIAQTIARAVARWLRHDGPGLAAAVSFYALFATAPIVLFGVMLTSRFLGPAEARASIMDWLSDLLPAEAAAEVLEAIHVESLQSGPWWSTAISALVLVWASSLIFVRLSLGIRRLFDEKRQGGRAGIRRSVLGRLFALGFAVGTGLFITLFVPLSSVLAPLGQILPVAARGVLGGANVLILVAGGMILLRIVPAETPRGRPFWTAGAFLLVLFLFGQTLLERYAARNTIATAYGVASSLVVFLIWIYFVACGYFIGVALCAELADRERAGDEPGE